MMEPKNDVPAAWQRLAEETKKSVDYLRKLFAGEVRVLPTFEEAWKKKEKEGYQYGEDALEQVRFGWEIRNDAERDAKYRMVPAHVTEAIGEENITDEDRALVKDFYENACCASWCEFDEAMILYAVVRSRLNAEKK